MTLWKQRHNWYNFK